MFVPHFEERHLEDMMFDKRHADQAKRFEPFAALPGYEKKVQAVISAINEPKEGSGGLGRE